MTDTTDDTRSTLESLRIDLPGTGDEVWNDPQRSDLDDSNPSTASSRRSADTPADVSPEARSKTAASAPRPDPARHPRARSAKLKTREEVFEHRMAAMAHRRAQLGAHRNRQARKWFAFTGALMFLGASGLGLFYYKTASSWTFLSSYSLDNPPRQVVQTAPAERDGAPDNVSSSSSHFQNAMALIVSPRNEQRQSIEDVVYMPVVEDAGQTQAIVEQAARLDKAPAVPVQLQPPAHVRLVAAKLEPAKPALKAIKPSTNRMVRIAPTAMPAQPETIYNLNNTQPSVARTELAGELIMVPAEKPESQSPTRKVASLSPRTTAPKSGSTSPGMRQTRSGPDEIAVKTALGLPPEALAMDNSTLTGDNTAAGQLPPRLNQNGEPVGSLLERGDRLLLLGDIVSARQLYKHAFQQGNQKAAARIGTTYDPRIFAQLGVRGLRPDPDLALDWYNKAVGAGDEEAKSTAQSLSAQISSALNQAE